MEIPRFAINRFDVRIAGADAGEAFQTFAAEALSARYPQLHAYRAPGRDGAIDLETASRMVIECKHCGGDDVQRAWKDVAAKLDKHLADPAGPGQSQYAPWYAANGDGITGYVFATDVEFVNKSRKDELRDEIRTFFDTLAKHPHLAHLRGLDVQVLDWSDFESELKARPALLFRWFPATRPAGLTPLDAVADRKLFRSFLSQETLPYYSRAAYLKTIGKPTAVTLAEDDLLRKLNDVTGLIITGKGGVGKTRLTLELGRRAREQGWLVMRASASFSDVAVDDLLVRLGKPTDVLLLVDYVETIPAFADRVEHIETLNATVGHRIRYIANCRTSYYRNVQTIGGHERVDVTPAAGTTVWLDDYRRVVVEKILGDSGIAVTSAHLKVCRDIPVFAVFMTYLQRQQRTADLHELVADGEFGTWIARRVQQSFERAIASDLATLLAMFPMSESRRAALPPPMRELFKRLVTDGWIEQLVDGPDAGQWVTAHDALADRVILNHIENLGPAAPLFIRELLSFSEAQDGIESALVSLQRLSDAAVLQAIDWVDLFAERLNGDASGWYAARLLILQNNLLSPVQRIALLEATRQSWDDLVGDHAFQGVLGWLCKQVAQAPDRAALPLDGLRTWVLRSAAQAKRQYLLSRGLSLFPELRDAAERWLASSPIDFQTQYILVSWLSHGHGPAGIVRYVSLWLETQHRKLEAAQFVYHAWLSAGGDRALVEAPIREWLEQHSESIVADFVYRAWLDAGGDRMLIEEPVRQWLEQHGELERAQFVYRAWLDAGGDRVLVEEPIRKWLEQHSESMSADFVYRAWLDAGGDRALIEHPIQKWLEQHGELEPAQFAYRAWLDAGGDRVLVEEPIRKWLEQHSESIVAGFVYRAWLNAGGDRVLVEEPVRRWLEQQGESIVAGFVYRAWLEAGGDCVLVEEPIWKWLEQHGETEPARFVYCAWLDAGGDRVLVEEPIRKWLDQHGELETAQFVYCAWLDAGGDRVLVEEPIRKWLEQHGELEAAQFVYCAWLDADCDRVLVEEPIRKWLEQHGRSEAAPFPCRAWLDAGGDRMLVEEQVIAWLEMHSETEGADFLVVAHLKRGGDFERIREAAMAAMRRLRDSPEGSFVSKVLARQRELPDEAVLDVLVWCHRYSDDDDALWRLSQLRDKMTRSAVAADACAAVEAVLTRWLNPVSLPSPDVAKMVTHVLATSAIFLDWRLRGRAYALLVQWLRHPTGFEVAAVFHRDTVLRVINLVGVLLRRGDLDLHTDADALARVGRWAERCAPASLDRFGTLADWFAAQAS